VTLVALATTTAFAVVFVAASSALSGSSFESADGNLVVNTAGNQDWANAPARTVQTDLTGSTSDNAFGQGAKEDISDPTVVSGSIPPNKSDLSRFYTASGQGSNNHTFLYLAWERTNVLGSANMDFELNQSQTIDTNGVTPVRTAGDLLFTYDFTNGGSRPLLGLLTWVTSGATTQCFSSNSLPCWGNHVDLTSAGDAEGAINTVTVTDPISGASLPGSTFGEMGVDLTLALPNVFGPNPTACESLGSAYLKSRSSASFSAEIKDFIAPHTVSVSNCGSITIRKVTENGDGSFGFSADGNLSPATFNLSNGGSRSLVSSGLTGVLAGTYHVSESSLPSGWTLKSLSCTATGSGTSATTDLATAKATITIATGGNVDCTYTNHTNATPTLATSLSATAVNVGDLVHDSATLSGAAGTPTGTVTYTAYTNDTCTAGAQDAGTVNLASDGSIPDSNAISFSTAGTKYWQASYSGDGNNNPVVSVCTSEQVVVKSKPSIATTLSKTTVSIGGSVSDSATLSAEATADAGGTVTYTVYTDNACSAGARDAGTVQVVNGLVPDSNVLTFGHAGTFYWQAVYSGDAKNNGATSPCTSEVLVVPPNVTQISTAQNLLPNDTATLSGLGGTAGGTVTFSLYAPSDATCAGTAAYTQTVPVSGSGSYSTSNTAFLAGTAGTWRWKVVYSGDDDNNGSTSACGVEQFTIANN
jgi:hypothetical protein